MTPTATVHTGDCRDVMRAMDPDTIDAIVTDPPYGLGFMGHDWDHAVPGVDFWTEALRVAKPGAHLLAFGGTRLFHRLVCSIEDAGWEIRDSLMWLYGSGFPKSLDVAKSIDKTNGHWRGRRGAELSSNDCMSAPNYARTDKGDPITEDAKKWDGWGTALKPSFEPILMARKPFVGPVVPNILKHGTGAINIDACRIGYEGGTKRDGQATAPNRQGWENMKGHKVEKLDAGRWPANVIIDQEAGRMMDQQRGEPVSRFFYHPKASPSDRGEGNVHPTVKPTDLMRYLVRMVTPPGGVVLDPFTGSGSTGKAARLEGFDFIGAELSSEYAAIAQRRIDGLKPEPERDSSEPTLFGGMP